MKIMESLYFFLHKKALKLSHELGTMANKNRYTLYDRGLDIKDDVSVKFTWWDTLSQRKVAKRKIRFDQTAISYMYELEKENKIKFNRYALTLNDLTSKEAKSLYKTFSRRKLDKMMKSLK